MREPPEELATLRQAGLLRELRRIDPAAPPLIRLDGRDLVNFASNDYLGLSAHPALREAARVALDRFGAGTGASRLISGSFSIHHQLEEHLAALKKRGAALTFANGYGAAVGVLTALAGRDDTLILDKLCHASLIDGARLSGATLRVYPHNNLEHLERLLTSIRARTPAGSRLIIVTESIFSMDGDRAGLPQIIELAERHEALLLVDEAHALGVAGPRGLGVIEELGLECRVPLQMGTLGKALGSAGGYLVADRPWIDLLVNKARSFIYSTAPPPAQVAAALAGLEVLTSAEGADLRHALRRNLSRLAGLTGLPPPPGAIVPLVIGSNERALAASRDLLEAGFFVPAIRFPTVPRHTARLRLTVSAAHDDAQITALAGHLHAREIGDNSSGRGAQDPQ